MNYKSINNTAGFHGRKKVTFDERDVNTSKHVLGVPKKGKSKFLVGDHIQNIAKGAGLFFADGHGTAVNEIVERVSAMPERFREKREVILLEPGSPTWTFGLNPFAKEYRDQSELDFRIDSMVNAIVKIWGKEMFAEPMIIPNLKALFHALASNKLNLADCYLFFDQAHGAERLNLCKNIHNPVARMTWDVLNAMKTPEYNMNIGGPLRRIIMMIFPYNLRTIFSHDSLGRMRDYMERGSVILLNLSSNGRFSEHSAKLLMGFSWTNIFQEAQLRRDTTIPFHVVIDEAEKYLTGDISDIIMKLRKYNCPLTIAHQSLYQLGEEGSPLRDSIVNGCQTKVVFGVGGMTHGDAKDVADMLFTFDPNKVKTWRHEVVGHEKRIIQSGSETKSQQNATQVNRGITFSRTKTESEQEGETETNGWTEGTHSSGTTSKTVSTGKSGAKTRGTIRSRSETFGDAVSESEFSGSSDGEVRSGDAPVPGMSEDDIAAEGGEILLSMSSNTSEGIGYTVTNSHSVTDAFSENESETEGWSVNTAIGTSKMSGSSSSVNGSTAHSKIKGKSSALGESVSASESETISHGKSTTRAWSETYIPILKKVPASFVPIQEQWYLAAAMLRDLPGRFCYIKNLDMRNALLVKTANVEDPNVPKKTILQYRKKILNRESSLVRFRELPNTKEFEASFPTHLEPEFDILTEAHIDNAKKVSLKGEKLITVLPDNHTKESAQSPSIDEGYADFDEIE